MTDIRKLMEVATPLPWSDCAEDKCDCGYDNLCKALGVDGE